MYSFTRLSADNYNWAKDYLRSLPLNYLNSSKQMLKEKATPCIYFDCFQVILCRFFIALKPEEDPEAGLMQFSEVHTAPWQQLAWNKQLQKGLMYCGFLQWTYVSQIKIITWL